MGSIVLGNLYINGHLKVNTSRQSQKISPVSLAGPEESTPPSPMGNAQKNEPAGSQSNMSIDDRFADKILERCRQEIAKRPVAKPDMTNAKLMAEALQRAAKQVEKHYGATASHNFMSQILSATDDKFDETRLVATIQSFFSSLESSLTEADGIAGVSKIGGFTALLNEGCEVLEYLKTDGEGQLNGGDQSKPESDQVASGSGFGLAYAMNLFFETVSNDDSGVTYKVFDMNFDWVTLSRKPIDMGSSESVTASELSKSETAEGVADYLLSQAGCENAADYIRGLPSGANFMEAVGTAVSIVLMEKGQKEAEEFVAYLNSNVKNEVDGGHLGDTFHGWRLGRDPNQPYDGLGNEQFEPNDFWFGSSEIRQKNHIDLITKWTVDSNGIGSYGSTDMNEAYARYLHMKEPQSRESELEAMILNEPTGNLVDSFV